MTTTTSTTTSPLTAALAGQLADDPAWADAFADTVSVHLAVMVEPYLSYVLDGSKTIESRFSRVRCAPAGVVSSGDMIAFKRTGGPVVAACRADTVRNFDQLTPSLVEQIRAEYADALCAHDPQFWADRADTRYATLIDVAHLRTVAPIEFPKRDRRGWVVVQPAITQARLL